MKNFLNLVFLIKFEKVILNKKHQKMRSFNSKKKVFYSFFRGKIFFLSYKLLSLLM